MACDECGGRIRHKDWCTRPAAVRQKKGRKDASKKNIMRPGYSPVCRTCDGDGSVVDHYQDKKGKWQHRSRMCPDCEGSGRIDE